MTVCHPRPLAASSPEQHHITALDFQEPFLQRQPAAISHQLAARSDDPMTGNHNRDRIGPVCRSYRPDRFRGSDRAGYLCITPYVTIRNGLELRPDALLKIGSLQVQRKIELTQIAVEIVAQLLTGRDQCRVGIVALARTRDGKGRNGSRECRQGWRPTAMPSLDLSLIVSIPAFFQSGISCFALRRAARYIALR